MPAENLDGSNMKGELIIIKRRGVLSGVIIKEW